MPSVIAYWSGQCREITERDELCLRMVDLAQLSNSFFKTEPPTVKKYNQKIEGDILLSTHLFPSAPSTAKLTRVDETYFSLRDVSLFGVEFQLYDGRGLYPGDDRMSFVFCVDDDPQINGLIVYVEDKEECHKYEDKRVQEAEYLLAVPHIHLRYYLEEWMDSLMGWVKYHYIDGLTYWRYEDHWVDRDALREDCGQFGRYEYYETLKSRFEKEVAGWTEISETAVQFWKPLRERQGNAD
jgi:hypothetical protein